MLTVFDAQTEILRWLESRGSAVDYGPGGYKRPTFRERSCKNKRRFDTQESALELEPTMHVYGCKFCGGFHLTTPR